MLVRQKFLNTYRYVLNRILIKFFCSRVSSLSGCFEGCKSGSENRFVPVQWVYASPCVQSYPEDYEPDLPRSRTAKQIQSVAKQFGSIGEL